MKTIIYEKRNKPLAQSLRRNMTPQERHLWYDFLKGLPITVRRQKQFGNYIVDFYIANANLVIELDGSGHYEPGQQEKDRRRKSYLERQGLKILRFSNLEVDREFNSVCETIAREAGILSDE